jgi:hypothetical protein
VHALVEASFTLEPRGGVALELLSVGGLGAVVERLDAAPKLSEASLRRQHAIVVGLARRAEALLPVRFGAFVPLDELTEVVRLRQGVLLDALERVRDHAQMTIRVFGSPAGHASIPRTSGTDYLRGRAAASRVTLAPDVKAVLAGVRHLVSAERLESGSGSVKATIDHLVRKRSIARYRRMVETALGDRRKAGDVTLTGPWPPFAFAPDIWAGET